MGNVRYRDEATFILKNAELFRESPPPPPKELIRLNYVMAQRGMCSRHEADRLIVDQQVLVNGSLAPIGLKVDPLTVKIDLVPKAKLKEAGKVTILLNKPPEYIIGWDRPGLDNAINLIIPDAQMQGYSPEPLELHPHHMERLHAIGRLPYGMSGPQEYSQLGLVSSLLTNDQNPPVKVYHVTVDIDCTRTRLTAVRRAVKDLTGPLSKSRIDLLDSKNLVFTLRGVGTHTIRDVCERTGLAFQSVVLTRIGNIGLGDLPLGEWRFLLPGEKFA